VVRGPYDPLLKWPFALPVTISLLEQISDRTDTPPRDVTKTFSPNPRAENEPFLGRPVETRNLSLGFPKFITLIDLFEGNYVKEDCIYIKVQVDLSSVCAA
jgi:TNF receptor-associated factor 4